MGRYVITYINTNTREVVSTMHAAHDDVASLAPVNVPSLMAVAVNLDTAAVSVYTLFKKMTADLVYCTPRPWSETPPPPPPPYRSDRL